MAVALARAAHHRTPASEPDKPASPVPGPEVARGVPARRYLRVRSVERDSYLWVELAAGEIAREAYETWVALIDGPTSYEVTADTRSPDPDTPDAD